MDENQAPLTAQKRSKRALSNGPSNTGKVGMGSRHSENLFSDSNSEILNTTQAASICGVSYHKFLREFGEIPYSFVYPGGPRIYMRSEVRAFIEGKNKWETTLQSDSKRGSIPSDAIPITKARIPISISIRDLILISHGNDSASNGRSGANCNRWR